MELHEAIKTIVDQFGKDVIAEKRFVNMIVDYYSFRDCPAEKRVLAAIVNDGYASRFISLSHGDDVSIEINIVINNICRNYGFRQELVERVVSAICEGLNIYHIGIINKEDGIISNSTINQMFDFQSSKHKYYLKKTILGRDNKELFVYNACGYYDETNGSFTILKGSLLAYEDFTTEWLLTDEKLSRKNTIEFHCHYDRPYYIVDSDIICSTPSQGVLIVTGTKQNGMVAWMDSNGNSIYQNKQSFGINKRTTTYLYKPKLDSNNNYDEDYIMSLYPILFDKTPYHAHMDFDLFQNKLKMEPNEAFQLFRFLKGMGVYKFNPYSDDYDLEVDSEDGLRKLYRNYIIQKGVHHIPLSEGKEIKRVCLEIIIKELYKFKRISEDGIKTILSSNNDNNDCSREIFNTFQKMKVVDGMGRCLNPYLTPEAMVNTIISRILFPEDSIRNDKTI